MLASADEEGKEKVNQTSYGSSRRYFRCYDHSWQYAIDSDNVVRVAVAGLRGTLQQSQSLLQLQYCLNQINF